MSIIAMLTTGGLSAFREQLLDEEGGSGTGSWTVVLTRTCMPISFLAARERSKEMEGRH